MQIGQIEPEGIEAYFERWDLFKKSARLTDSAPIKTKKDFICNEMKSLYDITIPLICRAYTHFPLLRRKLRRALLDSGEQLEGDKSVRRLLPRTKRQLSGNLTQTDPCPCLCFYRLLEHIISLIPLLVKGFRRFLEKIHRYDFFRYLQSA